MNNNNNTLTTIKTTNLMSINNKDKDIEIDNIEVFDLSTQKQQQQQQQQQEFENDNKSSQQVNKFDDLNLKNDLLRGIYAYGFEEPSDIQKKAILPVINGNDLVAQAQSGTGKTGAFCISALQIISDIKKPQVIIISPTHELADQSYNVAKSIGSFLTDINVNKMIGGTSKRESYEVIKKGGGQIIVGTPGRVNDMIRSKLLPIDAIKLLIVDEADEMLSRGFEDELKSIISSIPETSQITLFSATLSDAAIDITKAFLQNPIHILVEKEKLSLKGLHQYYIALENPRWKFDTITEIYENVDIGQTIIFCNSKREVDELAIFMEKEDHMVSVLHGGMTYDERRLVMGSFRSGSTRVLISSNVLARGIDVQGVSLVINFSICDDVDTYLHRIGRCARFGKKGVAINFVTPRDVRKMKNIEQHYDIEIEEMPMLNLIKL
jgi:translation initiation factor 4A